MRKWRKIVPTPKWYKIYEVDEAGNYHSWCTWGGYRWGNFHTTLEKMGWESVNQFLRERGRGFEEVTE